MNRDGRIEFFRHLDIDKKTIQLLYGFRWIKIQMLRGKDDYNNGKVYTEKPKNKLISK